MSFQPQLAISEGVPPADMLSLQLYLGVAFCAGSAAVGAVIVNNSTECRIARQYLCQGGGGQHSHMTPPNIMAISTFLLGNQITL